MKDGIWKTICSILIVFGTIGIGAQTPAFAQDSFRQFDRKLVVTPAELFRALSSFQPSQQQMDAEQKRYEEIEKAGLKFFSGLTPEQQEEAWKYAEKYLRKNGVDSASSKNLMREFGLPPEMQSELSKQFRKFSKRSTIPETSQTGNPDDGISDLLRKAREQFRAKAREARSAAKGNEQSEPSGDQAALDENDRIARDPNSAQPESNSSDRAPEKSKSNTPIKNQRRSRNNDSNEANQQTGTDLDDPFGQSNSSQTGTENATPFEVKKPRMPNSTKRSANANGKRQSRLPTAEQGKNSPKTSRNTDIDLDALLKRLEKRGKRLNAESGDGEANANSSGPNLDWENVIKKLAEEGTFENGTARSQGKSSNPLSGINAEGMLEAFKRARANREVGGSKESVKVDKSLLDRTKELFSGSLDRDKKSEASSLADLMAGNSKSGEKIGTRFDRLLVKAAERTITSANEDKGVTKSFGSAFGNLVERIQDQASKKKNERENNRKSSRSSGRKRGGKKSSTSSNNDQIASNGGNKSGGSSGQTSGSQGAASTSNSGTSSSGQSSFDPQQMLDSLRNLSSINPTKVFTFLAIVGFVLFLGYLVTQSFVGSESSVSKRKVIKQIRSTKIRSPKDLVETVDLFLLAKFGIKSSWWNARIAQAALDSGTPGLSDRVEELMQDYVRARYMRDDIEVPHADQQRYRKTLEELSQLDVSPKADFKYSASNAAVNGPAPVKG